MVIEIKHRFTERVLYSSDKAQNLRDANLSGANLRGAYLSGAYLSGAKNISPLLATPLLAMTRQPGVQRWYKIVTTDYQSPLYYQGSDNQVNYPIDYQIGSIVSVPDADTNPNVDCGRGINVATLDWLYQEYRLNQPLERAKYRLLAIDCKAKDIACIPTGTTGKIRLHRGTVFAELNMDEIYGKIEE